MDYFAGMDISMEETHVCVVDRDGAVVHEAKTASTPKAIAASLAKAPTCRRVVFETGRMAPSLYHGLAAVGLPVVCIESRHAYQALKSLANHKTDRNDARGLAHLARTGFFKPVHVKSLPAHAMRSLIIAKGSGLHEGPNPFAGQRRKVARSSRTGWQPFSTGELKALFAHPLLTAP
jgi:transposase